MEELIAWVEGDIQMPTASSSNLIRCTSSSDAKSRRVGSNSVSSVTRSAAAFDMIKLDVCVTLRADWETLGEPEI